MDPPLRSVTVDRISKAGNPVAKEKHNGDPILVFGAEPGDTVTIKSIEDQSFVRGEIVNPTEDQRERAKQQKKARQERLQERRRKKHNTKNWQTPSQRIANTKAKPELRAIGERLGGTSTMEQDEDALRSRWGGYGKSKDGRDKRTKVARKYD